MPPLILNLGLFTAPGKETSYRLIRRLSGPEGRSGRFVERNKSLGLIGILTPDRPVRSLVTIPTKLLRLQQQTGHARYRKHTYQTI